MMKAILSASVLMLLHVPLHGQVCQWAHSLGSANTTTHVEQLRPYAGTSALVCGTFAAPSLTLGSHSMDNNGQDDGFVALVATTGEYLWATSIGGADNDAITDVASLATGEIIAVGNYRSIFLTIGDTLLSNNGESDAFIVKFEADHSIAWVRSFGGNDIDEVTSVRADATGNIYVCGQQINKFTQQAINVFIQKYAPDGGLLWERTGLVQAGTASCVALALSDDQNIYTGGRMYGSVDFDGTTLIADQEYAAFMVAYDPSGALLSSKVAANYEQFTAIETHGNNVYTSAKKVNFSIGWGWPISDSKVYVSELDADLNTIWDREFGGETPTQSLDVAQGLSVDENGNAYVTGYFFSDTLFFAGDTLLNPYNAPYYYPQVFVAKYSASGDQVWALAAGGMLSDDASSILALGDDQFLLTGHFESDPAGFGEHDLHNTSELDSFYVHLYPVRYGRTPMGFLAKFDAETSTSIGEQDRPSFALWPNPSTTSVSVRTAVPMRSPFTVRISALDGRIMQQRAYPTSARDIHYDLDDLAPGPYLLTLLSAEGSTTKRFIKQ